MLILRIRPTQLSETRVFLLCVDCHYPIAFIYWLSYAWDIAMSNLATYFCKQEVYQTIKSNGFNNVLFFRIRIFEFYLTFKKARLFSVLERIKHVWFCKRVITKGLISKRSCLDHGEVWTISIVCQVANLVLMFPLPLLSLKHL